MEYLKAMRFSGVKKPDQGGDTEDKSLPLPADDQFVKSTEVNTTNSEPEDEDDDDFIMDEVKRRLKELRRNSFMELIPEEQSSPEDEEDEEEQGETSSSESRGAYAERHQIFSGLNAFYGRYCEKMRFFDALIVQLLHEIGSDVPLAPSPKPASKKLASSLRCLSMKKQKETEDEMEQQLQQPEYHPYHDLDSTYVCHLCLTWEAFHCQYTQFSQKISCGLQNSASSYNHCAQQFQQFEVLLQRFIENEPFEKGSRAETYARMRNSLPKLLQVPKVQGCEQKVIAGETSDFQVLATDVLSLMESSILTFYKFIRTEKKRSRGVQNTTRNHDGHMSSRFQQVQMSLEKKSMKLKEMGKRRKSWKKNTWPVIQDDVDLFLSIIDVKVLSRALKMARINTEQLVWCEEKIKKIDLSDGKLQRDPSPLMFPC